VVGDCWTGTFLVDLSSSLETATATATATASISMPAESGVGLKLGVIDFEFAHTNGRGPHGDLAQLLAHLELFRIAAEHAVEYIADEGNGSDNENNTKPNVSKEGNGKHALSCLNALISAILSSYASLHNTRFSTLEQSDETYHNAKRMPHIRRGDGK
jgi:hypothetical protein